MDGAGDRERRILGKKGYVCGRLLGKGAFSRVYYVEDAAGGGGLACKVSGNRELLRREADIMGRLAHPLFPAFYGFWQEAGSGFLLMEYVPGCSAEEMIGRRGSFRPGQVARFGMELAEGLLYLHDRPEKLLFRDIKPANIIIRQDGRIRLLDFGCVCSMRDKPGAYAGSLGYAAPEQLRGDGILTAACDVYGLGRTLERFLGAEGETQGGSGRERAGDCRWGTGKSLLRILEECTRPEPSRRIPDMRAVMDALARPAGTRWGTGRRRRIVYQKNIFDADVPF